MPLLLPVLKLHLVCLTALVPCRLCAEMMLKESLQKLSSGGYFCSLGPEHHNTGKVDGKKQGCALSLHLKIKAKKKTKTKKKNCL